MVGTKFGSGKSSRLATVVVVFGPRSVMIQKTEGSVGSTTTAEP
jgi:hypothetical protein